MAKKVFISIIRPPVGTSYYVEGLRLALGILGGEEEHEVTVAHIGRGVMGALKGVDRSYAKEFLDLFPRNGVGSLFFVERESLEEQGVAPTDLAEGFAVASRDELRRKMLGADATFSF
jgi:sulfur relay (sulfurtransferase) DsrF/TusC family protein